MRLRDPDVPLVIPAGVREAILAHARAEAPRECCGLLVGTPHRLQLAVPARNIAEPTTSRYQIDPTDHFAAIRQARAAEFDVVGAYHSHPRSAAVPSQTDLAAGFEDFIYLIVGPLAGDAVARLSAYHLVGGNFAEIRLVPE